MLCARQAKTHQHSLENTSSLTGEERQIRTHRQPYIMHQKSEPISYRYDDGAKSALLKAPQRKHVHGLPRPKSQQIGLKTRFIPESQSRGDFSSDEMSYS